MKNIYLLHASMINAQSSENVSVVIANTIFKNTLKDL